MYSRNCPKCDRELQYESKQIRNRAITCGRLCRNCASFEQAIRRKGLPGNRKGCSLSDIQKQQISVAVTLRHKTMGHPMLGKHHSEETIEKMKSSNSGDKNGMFGKHHSNATRKKISIANTGKRGPTISEEGMKILRIKRIKEIEQNKYEGNQIIPSFNKNSCVFFEKLNLELGWNGKHATNGGEYQIKELGYFLDYYEPSKNIIIEWDEHQHYVGGELKNEDRNRQREIEQHLGCKVIRINEETFNEEEFIQFIKKDYIDD